MYIISPNNNEVVTGVLPKMQRRVAVLEVTNADTLKMLVFSKVNSLLNSLCKRTIALTFENFAQDRVLEVAEADALKMLVFSKVNSRLNSLCKMTMLLTFVKFARKT